MKEIEVKAKLENPDMVIGKLQELGCNLSGPIVQHDRIYTPTGSSAPVPNGVNVLRVREQNEKFLLTIKQQVTNEMDCLEHEFEICNPDEAIAMFALLGFEKFAEVRKTRRKTKYGSYEICLDEVEGLGRFIEVEQLAEDADSAAVQEQLFAFLQTLGIKKEDQVFHGYDILMKKIAFCLRGNPGRRGL